MAQRVNEFNPVIPVPYRDRRYLTTGTHLLGIRAGILFLGPDFFFDGIWVLG